jgi:hypothetical protein
MTERPNLAFEIHIAFEM